ncbi:MAG: hypothetical protein KF784_15715 [Fimbriimonadaceae bacterium]|nr:hypothetical protein [Fimbriimonadaceae bacterium]
MSRDDSLRKTRLAAITSLIQREVIERQEDLVAALESQGFSVTQSSISRDLHDLGVAKVGGRYVLMGESLQSIPQKIEGILSFQPAGPNLLVLRTLIGAANLVAVQIDQLGWPELVGTIAGDDTIFIATASAADQDKVWQKLLALSGRETANV